MGKFDKHVARAAAAMPAGGEQVGGLRGALRGAVHGRGMPVDHVHAGGGALGGRSLLMLAAERGRADCVAVLLDEFSAGAGAAADGASSGQEALRLARAGGHDAAAVFERRVRVDALRVARRQQAVQRRGRRLPRAAAPL